MSAMSVMLLSGDLPMNLWAIGLWHYHTTLQVLSRHALLVVSKDATP